MEMSTIQEHIVAKVMEIVERFFVALRDLPEKDRREVLKKLSERDGCGTAIKKMTLLRNITADRETKSKAKADAEWLAKQGFCKLKTKQDAKK